MPEPTVPDAARMTDEAIGVIIDADDKENPEKYPAPCGGTIFTDCKYRVLATAAEDRLWPIAYAAGQAAGWETAAEECTTSHLKWADLEPVLRELVAAAQEIADSRLIYPAPIVNAQQHLRVCLAAAREALEEG